MARNVGVNSTFEQQRLVINELAVDVETLENAGYITGYTEQDNLSTVLARGNQATSDILLTGIITATSFVGDGSNLTGISAGAGGTDNVSTSTLSVAGVSTFNGRIIGAATTNIIPFLYANLSDLPSATDYHGAFAHVHATGKAYYAHNGAWVELVNAGVDGTVGTGNESYNVGVITASQFVGDGSGLTGVVAQGTGIVIQEEGSSVGTAGTINFVGTGVTATLANGIASVEITSSGTFNGGTVSGSTTFQDDVIIAGAGKSIQIGPSNDQLTLTNDTGGSGTISHNNRLFVGAQTGIEFYNLGLSEPLATFTVNGGVELFYDYSSDNTPKIKTTSTGVEVNGNVIANSAVVGSGITINSSGANITGVVTATRFESTSAGTPTIDSPNNLNINAVTVAISTDLTVGGNVTASQFVGDGSGLTGVVAQGTGIVIQEEGSSVGTAGTINFIGAGVTATLANGIASVEITSSGGGGGGISNIVEDTTPQLGGNLDLNNNNITGTGDIPAANLTGTLPAIDGSNLTNISYSETDTLATVTSRGNTTTAEITAANFRSNDTTGDGSDVGFALKYYITSNSSSAYRFAGPGVLNTTDNPTLYFHRGFTYILENSTGSGHPFELRVSNGGSAYAPGGNFLTGSINGTQILTVPFDAPNSIVYQCTLHSGMVGTINFVS